MRSTVSILIGCCLIAVLSGPAFAGSPGNPGGLGQTVNAAKDFWQANAGSQNGWGQAVKANNEAGAPSLGQQLQAAKSVVGASPDPANDNGGGNGP
jgi:hypothetical protein